MLGPMITLGHFGESGVNVFPGVFEQAVMFGSCFFHSTSLAFYGEGGM